MVGYGAIAQPAEPRQQPGSGARTRRVALALVVCTVAVSAIVALGWNAGPVALMGYHYPRHQQQLAFGLEDPWVGVPYDLAGPDPWETTYPQHHIWEGFVDPADTGYPPSTSPCHYILGAFFV